MSDEVREGTARLLAGLLAARTGQQLAPGRRWRIDTALSPLAAAHPGETIDSLARRATSGREPELSERVIDALLNHETSFFRDVQAFRQLEGPGLARLRATRGGVRRLSVWSAGCSTGQEAYTLAMALSDGAGDWDGWRIDILGTDVSAHAIARARTGRYTQFEIQRGLPVGRMLHRFAAEGSDWRADPALRGAVRFAVHNLIEPPPPGRFDLVLCRNVLLYFPADVRRLVFERIAGAMAPDGLLMLGAGETTMGHTDRFVSDYACRGFYRPCIEALRAA